jgi:hypothetical protein
MVLNGLRSSKGMAATPFTQGPYTWDQRLAFGSSTSAGANQSSVAGTRWFEVYMNSTATSGDNRAQYVRLWLSGANASGGGESLRAFTTVEAACGTAHGAHISLSFGAAGSLSGLGVAMRGTLHIPDNASWTSGTIAALQAEIYSDGAASDPDGVTEVSFIRVVNGGDTTGAADIDTDAVLFSLQGFTANTGSLVELGTGMGTVTGTLKIKIGADIRYLPFYSAAG